MIVYVNLCLPSCDLGQNSLKIARLSAKLGAIVEGRTTLSQTRART